MGSRKEDALKMNYWSVFQYDIINTRLSNIQKLYDSTHITNDMLIKQLDKNVAAMTDLTNAVFNDIAYILLGVIARKVLDYKGYGNVSKSRIKEVTKSGRFRMLSLLHMRNENLVAAGTLQDSSIIEASDNWRQRESGSCELYLDDDKVVFTIDEEPIFKSTLFEKYIRRQKEALATYLGIPAEKLASYFNEKLKYDVRREDFTFSSQR